MLFSGKPCTPAVFGCARAAARRPAGQPRHVSRARGAPGGRSDTLTASPRHCCWQVRNEKGAAAGGSMRADQLLAKPRTMTGISARNFLCHVAWSRPGTPSAPGFTVGTRTMRACVSSLQSGALRRFKVRRCVLRAGRWPPQKKACPALNILKVVPIFTNKTGNTGFRSDGVANVVQGGIRHRRAHMRKSELAFYKPMCFFDIHADLLSIYMFVSLCGHLLEQITFYTLGGPK